MPGRTPVEEASPASLAPEAGEQAVTRLEGTMVLEQVDTVKAEGVWSVLDEGCNSTGHSAEWAERAEKVFKSYGFDMPWVSRRDKVFSRLGGHTVRATGRRRPFRPSVRGLLGRNGFSVLYRGAREINSMKRSLPI